MDALAVAGNKPGRQRRPMSVAGGPASVADGVRGSSVALRHRLSAGLLLATRELVNWNPASPQSVRGITFPPPPSSDPDPTPPPQPPSFPRGPPPPRAATP